MAKKKLEAGDKVVFHDTKANRNNPDIHDLTFGKIYTVEEGIGEFFVYDDVGDANYACDPESGSAKWTKIVD